MQFKIGDILIFMDDNYNRKDYRCPELELQKQYTVLAFDTCPMCGKQHVDVGLRDTYNARSICNKCGFVSEKLDNIWWISSHRFLKKGPNSK